MLFNSLPFIFAFLPVAVAGYWLLRRYLGTMAASAFLALASLAFYLWWRPSNLPILAASIAFNFLVGIALARKPSKVTFGAGILANLCLLGWFKYSAFFWQSLGLSTAGLPRLEDLPIGISFYTFTQIAYLTDVYRKRAAESGAIDYTLFVSYFPHLIAGPILHHKEMMPQFASRENRSFRRHLAVGLAIFTAGLFKKVFLADPVGTISSPLFNAAAAGAVLTVADAWTAALAYTLQLYLDFSAYCDMACGISFMLGIRLPINFFSPYKATSMIDFWRRWHMTLSRFLRDYLYIPLGGNRHGSLKRYRNLALTMVLGGLWHGAAWTFVAWGAFHGSCLVVNHLYRATGLRMHPLPAWALTFLAVIVGWVFFRAANLDCALGILSSMMGIADPGAFDPEAWGQIAVLMACVLLMPNIYQIFSSHDAVLFPKDFTRDARAFRWAPSMGMVMGFGAGIALSASIFVISRTFSPSEFLYFQF